MRKGKVFLLISWLGAVGILVLMTVYNQDKVDRFLGLTSSKESVLTYPYAIYIKKIYVRPGDNVKKGDLLADAVRADVTPQSNLFEYKIEALEAKRDRTLRELHQKLEELDIARKLQIMKIESDIKVVQLKIQKNRQLEASLDDIKIHIDNRDLNLKIKALKKKRGLLNDKFLLKENNLKNEINEGSSPIDANIKGLDTKRNQLLKKEDEVKIYAPYDCQIGSISYKDFSYVKNYSKIMSMHPSYPKYVVGYIHEDIENKLIEGQTVYIEPLSKLYKEDMIFEGKVVNISSRIEGFPIRLKKYKIVPLWGYKVLIELPQTTLKLGQKVSVSTENSIAESSKIEKILRFLKLK